MSHKKTRKEKNFVSVSIPTELIKRVDAIIEAKKHGYESRPEFIKDAIRRRFRELGLE